MLEILRQIFYIPLYNAFALFLSIPYVDAGLAVILFTVVIRAILYPLSRKALLSQMRIQELQPELTELRNKYKDNKEEQARRMMALYKDKNINPFSGILFLLLQIPIIISLYYIFSSGALASINASLLYSFVPIPPVNDHTLFGIIDLTAKSVTMAVLAGVSQYFVAYFQQRKQPQKPKLPAAQRTFQDDLARSMSFQMKYFFPLLAAIFALNLPSVIGLYWTVGALFNIFQEILLKKERERFTPQR
jgi:YidC/Oxa1 family membrane protein insertase